MDLLSMVQRSVNADVLQRLSSTGLDSDVDKQYTEYVSQTTAVKSVNGHSVTDQSPNNFAVIHTSSENDKQTTEKDQEWLSYAKNENVASVENSKTKPLDKKRISYRKTVQVNANSKMIGFIENPMMTNESHSSVAGELSSGAQQAMSKAMNLLGGVGDPYMNKALTWVNWTCPSSAFILPPGISWIWQKSSSLLNVFPLAGASDQSIASSMATGVSEIVNYADNWRTGYNRSLFKVINTQGASIGSKNFISIKHDAYLGKRITATNLNLLSKSDRTIKDTSTEGKVYRYLHRNLGSDLTGAKLREKRFGVDNVTGKEQLKEYDKHTFFEFTYPAISQIENAPFRGALTNMHFNAGRKPTVDFIVKRPDHLNGLPKFSYIDLAAEEEKDISFIGELSGGYGESNLDIIGWGSGNNNIDSGIQQGPWDAFHTYRNLQRKTNTISTDFYETEDFPVWEWMFKYFCYYYYKENDVSILSAKNGTNSSMQLSYMLNYINPTVHRSPYECYYYMELYVSTTRNPAFLSYVYMVVPRFDFQLELESSRYGSDAHYQKHQIKWEIIGQVKSSLGEESSTKPVSGPGTKLRNLTPAELADELPSSEEAVIMYQNQLLDLNPQDFSQDDTQT
ncbi:MAG: hypothetical protein MJZ34_02890 [Paludibacteraceae bacterium]|nr:hypothetical protein [Paludibacteraceae bacterium]